MSKKILSLLALILFVGPVAFAQSRDTGAIRGAVTDDQGQPLPGVSVTVTSPNLMGSRVFVTDAQGQFRFPALPPGDYQVKAEIQGFGTVIRENLRLSTTTTLTVDIEMKPASVTEEVTVIAKSPTVDVKSTETASVTLSNEILRNIPYNQFTADIVNLAPGVVDNVAFGASQNTGIAYTMDGVNVADPDAGSAWVFSDHNIIEEAKVMGIGLPAEYGNFTGVIFNLITKSGGNQFSGHFEFNFQGYQATSKFWQATNNQAYAGDFPDLTSPSSWLMDLNGHVGGPIVRDKLWFYTGVQFYRTKDRATGFPEDIDYKQPRFFIKLTSQLSNTLNVNAMFQATSYNGINRGAGATTSPEACVTQESPDWLAGFNLNKVLSSTTFFDLKTNYFRGRYYLDPEVDFSVYSHFDLNDNMLYDSAGSFYYADRARFGTNASVTHYAEDFLAGSHEFKFGAEFERSMVRNRYGFTGTGGALGDHIKYIDLDDGWYTGPYLAYQYQGYDNNTRYTRLEGFAQDSWQVSKRLNLSLGVRYSMNWGDVKYVDGPVYKTNRLAPRLGFTFDVLGDKTTILKGHYGQFTEGMFASFHDRMNPDQAYHDYVSYYYDPGDSQWHEWERIVHESLYSMDPDIKHPYMEQFTAGLERELFKDTSVGVTYINRRWKNIIGPIDRAGDYDRISYYVPELGRSFQIYERTAATLGTYDYLITNLVRDDAHWVMDTPYRKYSGLEVLFNKRFSNRWQLLASYVYGKATGTMDNGFGDDIGYGGNTYDPNFWINADGRSTVDPTHMIKVQGTYVLPLDINFNFYYRGITGDAWTQRYRTSRLNQGRVTFFTEPRGSNHYPMRHTLDLRLEKVFTVAKKYRLGVMLDVFNVFNDDTITSWGTRIGYDWYPGDWPSTNGHELYGFAEPRQARVGFRLIF
ncbi:MAG TPA: TonB-dependent receptor [Candidatus Aminicenantes bacterium]|nr:TonB-dependent receptor [Candidatus Aminicenantes bacterium]